MDLKDYKTCELVEELKKREGVFGIQLDPYETKEIVAEGPMILLKIID